MKPYEKPKIQKKLSILKEAILSVVPNTEAIYLFGSYVNGTPHEYSDLDVFVVIPEENINELDLYKKIRKIFSDKGDKYMPIDLLFKTSKKFYHNIYFQSFDRIVFRTGIKIYG